MQILSTVGEANRRRPSLSAVDGVSAHLIIAEVRSIRHLPNGEPRIHSYKITP